MRKLSIVSIFILSILSLNMSAQGGDQKDLEIDFQKINRAVSFGIGHANVFDTYLSPQEYKGIDFRVSRESIRMTNRIQNTSIQNFIEANISYTNNYADNNNSFSGMFKWNYGMHYQFHLTPNFKLLAGGLLDANLGFIYNLRNGNNPASAKAYLNLTASGMAIWHTKIKNYPMVLRYQINVPLLGMMFSPHYGQSYYEIFSVGNSSNILNFTPLHNQPSFRQYLTIDLPIRQSTIRISYVADIQQSKLQQIKTHYYTHSFMVGFVHNLFKLRNKPVDAKNKHLNAY